MMTVTETRWQYLLVPLEEAIGGLKRPTPHGLQSATQSPQTRFGRFQPSDSGSAVVCG
jgi:hypothetical protein